MDGFSSSSPASSAASSCHRPLSYPQRSAAPRRMQCGRAALVVRRSRPCVRPSLMLWRLHRGRPPCPAASCSSSATPADITSNTVVGPLLLGACSCTVRLPLVHTTHSDEVRLLLACSLAGIRDGARCAIGFFCALHILFFCSLSRTPTPSSLAAPERAVQVALCYSSVGSSVQYART